MVAFATKIPQVSGPETLMKNLEPESLRLSGADFSILLATPAASLVPNVLAFVFPVDLPAMRREGGLI